MARALIASLAMVLAAGVLTLDVPALHAAQQSTPATADSQPSPNYDAEAERRLLELANRERARAGLAPLQEDEGLTQAAREHSAAMAAQRKLSHQFSGELNLVRRLAANTKTRLDQAGENVAFAGSLDQAQDSLMHSPPHRANLLNSKYNVAGFSVVRSGTLLFVTQDFGHSLPNRSDDEAEVLVGRSIDHIRSQARLPGLGRMDSSEAADAACAMAKADSLKTPAPLSRAVVRYTTPQPQTLPVEASQAIGNASLHAVAVGSCYARSATYPTGVYWVVLLFY